MKSSKEIGPVSRWAWRRGIFTDGSDQYTQDRLLFVIPLAIVVHEGGHLLFGCGLHAWALGGTILLWIVPLLLATISLFSVRHCLRVCMFFFLRTGFTPRPTRTRERVAASGDCGRSGLPSDGMRSSPA
jgi:hypothetical protein